MLRKKEPLLKMLNNTLIDLPAPVNISSMWNFGSLLSLCLMLQLLTGILLSFHYSNSLELAFSSVIHICRDVNFGWGLRTLHANTASLFFICLFLHTGRGIYYTSYFSTSLWNAGVTLLLLTMGTAFLGYVLPWGQMSFWGATVITNLLSALPYVGVSLVYWLWGGFAVDGATLTRFFTLHFLLPFIMLAFVLIHILFLHQKGSNNPLGVVSQQNKIPFHPYYIWKDLVGCLLLMMILFFLILLYPYSCGDPENFIPANPLSTPPHIQPEWYYLFAYAILRAIPSKLGGVIALISSIFILYFIPYLMKMLMKSYAYYPLNKLSYWSFITIFILLTWIGACPVEPPYVVMSQFLTLLYFAFFFLSPYLTFKWNLMQSISSL